MVRTRIAPSPTGYPHIGTMYQVLFDYAYAKKHDGKFIVRIEDTDRTRFVEDAEEKLFAALDYFGLSEDESPRKGGPFEPYRQSERLAIYQEYAKELVDNGHAYYCFCSKERLEEVRLKMQAAKQIPMYDKHCRDLPGEEVEKNLLKSLPCVIRMKIPHDATIVVKDEIRGDISFVSETIDDQVIMKSDGFPTYHLAVVVDDHLMEITHVVRGEEWLTSTPKHFLLYEYFGWEKPLFYHTPALRNPDKSKMSKRHSHTNVSWYQTEGYLPETILNFLALLGWSHPEEKEEFTLEEFIQLFDLQDIKPVGPIFDLQKLTWLNGIWMRRLNTEILVQRLQAFYKDDEEVSHFLSRPYAFSVAELAKTRMRLLKEFKDLILPAPYDYSPDEQQLRASLKAMLREINTWENEDIFAVLKAFQEQYEVSFKTLYILLTGRKQGLPLSQYMEYLGKDESLALL